MTERLVKLAGIGFRSAEDTIIYNSEGQPVGIPQQGFGTRGQTVDVHDDDLERFDKINDQYDDAQVAEATGPEDNDERSMSEVVPDKSKTDHPLFPQGPDPLDHGAGGDIKRPDRREPVAVWREYAERLGVEDADELTKKELIDETADLEEERAEEYRRAAAGEGAEEDQLEVDDDEEEGFEEVK